MDETECDRLKGAAQVLASGCTGVSVYGGAGVSPEDVKAIARAYVAQRFADVAGDADQSDFLCVAACTLFVLGSIASIALLVLTVAGVKF